MQGKARDINFTEGNIIRNIVLFSIPIIISEILQNLYNSVDSIVVGHFVSDAALAAVSVCTPIANLLVSFFNGMSLGNTVVVAKAYGYGDKDKTREAIRYAYTFSVVVGVLFSVIGILLAGVMLDIARCNAEIHAEAIVYLRIYLAGLMFTVIYNCGTGILRAIGDSRMPLYILAGTSVLNIVLDLVFVVAFDWGTAGVGAATIVAQGCSMLLVTLVIRRRIGGHCVDIRNTWKYGRRVIAESLSIGSFAGLQGAVICLSNVFVWRYINIFPTNVSAGVGVAQKIDKFVFLPCKAFSMTVTTHISQNLGAGKVKRARAGIGECLKLCMIVTLLLDVLVFFLRFPISGFYSPKEGVIAVSAKMLVWMAPFYPILAFRELLMGALRGYGYSRGPMICNILGMVVFRQILLAIVMPIYPSETVIYAAFPVCWCLSGLLVWAYYASKKKIIAAYEIKDAGNAAG